jgi:cysteinyl-tRNA synthetase
MLAKITTKNQLTLPKAVVQQMGKPEYVDVALENGRVILTPVQVQPADAVRNRLAALGITEQDVEDAVSWGRGIKA